MRLHDFKSLTYNYYDLSYHDSTLSLNKTLLNGDLENSCVYRIITNLCIPKYVIKLLFLNNILSMHAVLVYG